MLINLLWKNVLRHRCPLGPLKILTNANTFSLVSLMSSHRNGKTAQTVATHQVVEDPCCSRSLFTNFQDLPKKLSIKDLIGNGNSNQDGLKDQMDQIEARVRGRKKYKKIADYLPNLRAKTTFITTKRKFSTGTAFRSQKKIFVTKQHRRLSAPLTPEELVIARDEEFYDIRKQLEGVYCTKDREKPKKRTDKCPVLNTRLECCSKRDRENCDVKLNNIKCQKAECPYPSYVECKDLDPEPPFTECLLCPIARADFRARKLAKKCKI